MLCCFDLFFGVICWLTCTCASVMIGWCWNALEIQINYSHRAEWGVLYMNVFRLKMWRDKVETEAAMDWDRKCSEKTHQICLLICTEQTSKSVSVNVFSYTWTDTQWGFHLIQRWGRGFLEAVGIYPLQRLEEAWHLWKTSSVMHDGTSNPSHAQRHKCSSFLHILKWIKKKKRKTRLNRTHESWCSLLLQSTDSVWLCSDSPLKKRGTFFIWSGCGAQNKVSKGKDGETEAHLSFQLYALTCHYDVNLCVTEKQHGVQTAFIT